MAISISTKHNFKKPVVFHISLKESNLGIGFKKKFELKKSKDGKIYQNFFYIIGNSKPSMCEEDRPGLVKHYEPGKTVPVYVPPVAEFAIPLYNQWISFLTVMTKAYHYEFSEDQTVIRKRLSIFANETGRKIKYTIGLYADIENKAPVVLSVEKREGEKLLEKFRQPMFYRYLHEFLTIAMSSAFFVDDFEYRIEKSAQDVLPIKYKNMQEFEKVEDSTIFLGIKKIGGKGVFLGRITEQFGIYELPYSDIVAFNISCKNKILTGKWLPFVGEKISISQDGYLTDLSSEMNLDERDMGYHNAWQYFYATAVR